MPITKTAKMVEIENKINKLANLKQAMDLAKAEFDSYKDELENELGLGTWESDLVKLAITESTRKTIAWQKIATDNIAPAILSGLVENNTTTSVITTCRITPKLVIK